MDPSLTILLVEDNNDDALMMQRAFKDNGLMRPLHIVRDGSEAIDYLLGDKAFTDRISHPFPNMMILDLKMPRVSGFEVLQWVHQHPDYRVIPTIVWSASSDTRDVKHAFCLGGNAYLCKPSNYETLVAMTGRLLAFWEDCLKPGLEPIAPSCSKLENQQPYLGALKTRN